MTEIWRDVLGYEKLYQASNLGRIKSLPRNGTIKAERILKLTKHHSGYLVVNLHKDDINKMFVVQRLIYEAFNGPIPKGMQVNHINEDKTDNRLCNLNLMTPKENTNWGTCIQRRNYTRTKNNKGCKPISQFTQDGEYIRTYSSMSEIVRLNGGCRANIYYCCKGITKTAYGFIWRYAA